MNKTRSGRRQDGSVLLMALVFLVLTALIAVTIMDTSVLEIKMAANQQFKVEANQHAEGVIRDVMDKYDDPANPSLPISIPYGSIYCATSDTDADCDEKSLYISAKLEDAVPAGVDLLYRGTRLHSQKATVGTTETASSGQTFHYIEMFADYDGVSVGLSSSRIAAGLKISQFTPGSQQFVNTEEGGWGLY